MGTTSEKVTTVAGDKRNLHKGGRASSTEVKQEGKTSAFLTAMSVLLVRVSHQPHRRESRRSARIWSKLEVKKQRAPLEHDLLSARHKGQFRHA